MKAYEPLYDFGTVTIHETRPTEADYPIPDDVVRRFPAFEASRWRNALDGRYPGLEFDREFAGKVCDAWCQCFRAAKAYWAARGVVRNSHWMLCSIDRLKGGGLRANTTRLGGKP